MAKRYRMPKSTLFSTHCAREFQAHLLANLVAHVLLRYGYNNYRSVVLFGTSPGSATKPSAWVVPGASFWLQTASKSSSNSSGASRRKYVKKDTVLPSKRRCDCGHMPVHGEKRAVCWLCRWKHREQGASDNLPKTKWSCSQCALPLCTNKERNCFSGLHYL
jgi:hypothetical protein